MATNAPSALLWLAREWESAIDTAARRQDAATFSGIVGDPRHRETGGYHISREDLIASGMGNDYSLQFSDDRLGAPDEASAIDMNMDAADMRLVTGRLVAAWRRQDPRLANLRAVNGTLDGVNAIRIDAANDDPDQLDESSTDHLWHIHAEIFRRYANDMATMRDLLAVITGGVNPTSGTAEQQAPIGFEETGMMLYKERGGATIVLTDWIRTVTPSDADCQAMRAAGMPQAEVSAELVGLAMSLPRPGVPTAQITLTDAQAASIGDRIGAALAGHAGLTQDQVTVAVRAALHIAG